MRVVEYNEYDISTDGRTVWVNGASLLGRFGLMGIDIHRPLLEQVEHGECLFCTQGETTREDWDLFVVKMEEHYGIRVAARWLPRRLRPAVRRTRKS
jgi:hypothetical protein